MAEATGEFQQEAMTATTEESPEIFEQAPIAAETTQDSHERTPYSVVTLEAFTKSLLLPTDNSQLYRKVSKYSGDPEHIHEVFPDIPTDVLERFRKVSKLSKDLDYVLEAIDRQMIENYSRQESLVFPGVTFPMSRVVVIPSMVRGLSSAEPVKPAEQSSVELAEPIEEETDSKRIDYFLFPAYAPPPDGGPFYVQDLGIDRVIRELPKVARALQAGEAPPEITVYFMGSPTALGGQVTEEWISEVNKNGMDTYGRLYAEYINSLKARYTVEESEAEAVQQRFKSKEKRHGNDRIVLWGVSKGAIVADKTSDHLDPKLQRITQRLLDNPSGDHKPGETGKALQSAAGLVGETVGRLLVDPMMQGLMKRNPSFGKYIQNKKNIQPDSNEQTKLKMQALLAESKTLFSGQPLDSEKRSFERQGLQDPLSANLEDLRTTSDNTPDARTLLSTEGNILKSKFKGHHFFYLDRYKRWVKILEFCKKTSKDNG
ncbi:hypothetical protein HY469_01805 [Candidatus Roizmanbacteria bacterium]|nr:hypothetical protein [Candidatus Roizmanbacteria bacterium]